MNTRLLARALAGGRIAAGVALIAAPRQVAVAWLGKAGERPQAHVLARAVGARDLAIGIGALGGKRDWIAAGVLSDTVDAVATLLAGERIPPTSRLLVGSIAVSGALAGAALAARPGAAASRVDRHRSG